MKKRYFSLALFLALLISLTTVPVHAALPQGFWPYLSAYNDAVAGGVEEDILSRGDAYLSFLAGFPRDREIAENQYNVYFKRLEMGVFESRNDWDRAIENTNALLDVSEYLQSIGVDRSDVIRRCQAHLAVLPPFTGVYAASYTQSNTYGSKIAAASGAYYGTIADGGHYADRSICSFYVELEEETAAQYDFMISPRADGSRVILINLNFKNEGATARAIPGGAYDDNIRATLSYLAGLNSPVLLRIGGEMDLWSTPEEFTAAYRHIASMARSLAPKVELVWSPNYVADWNTDTAAFYPGDDVVDWVGLSLYYNYPSSGGEAIEWLEYSHSKQFADPIANADRVLRIAKAHNKPAIATEGGMHRGGVSEDVVAKQAAKEFSTLTMAYPQVKALVYFDRSRGGNDYTLSGAVKEATDAAIDANPTLIQPGKSSAATYVPIDRLDEQMSGTLILGATGRTYHSTDMSAVWKLDDGQAVSTAGSPNQYRIDLSALASGSHRLEVTLSDGKGYTAPASVYTLSYTDGRVKITEGYTMQNPASESTQDPASESTQTPASESAQDPVSESAQDPASESAQDPASENTQDPVSESTQAPASESAQDPASDGISVTVDGQAVQWTDAKPFIDANSRTMVPLRAVGDALGLTVDWDGERREASFTDGKRTLCFPIDSSAAHADDGTIVQMDTAAVISGSRTYAPVRYLAEFFGHSVEWDGDTRTVIIK